MSKFVLFSLLALLAFSNLMSAQAADPGASTSHDGSAAAPANPFAGMPKGLDVVPDSDVSERVRTCLRIHAFIFKTEDDRVPELVRETTCVPTSRAGAKKANLSVQPKLVPATGGSHF